MIRNVLSIAGSDPSGGAGIQADLKTISALGCYGMAAMTALTAQNTRGVTGVHDVPADFVGKQIEAIFDDIRVDAVKIGMAGSPRTIAVLGEILQKRKPPVVVLDPVMVAQSGDRLVSDESVAAMKTHLFPLATIITPNIPEAAALLNRDMGRDLAFAAQLLVKQGARSVLLKGGHDSGEFSNDIYADKNGTKIIEAKRIATRNNHGTGCTLSSAIACFVARGLPVDEACRAAKKYVTEALRHSDELKIGTGHGPVHHFHAIWSN